MEPRIFFTADTHFGHRNIIKHCNRPFNTVQEMDQVLIENWNKKVRPKDFVFHLGDVSVWYGKEREFNYDLIMSQLNGTKILIRGNHDKWLTDEMALRHFRSVHEQLLVRVPSYGPRGGKLVLHLLHAPLRSWYHRSHGALHFFGHVHGQLENSSIPGSIDVGVDVHNQSPISLEEALVHARAELYWSLLR